MRAVKLYTYICGCLWLLAVSPTVADADKLYLPLNTADGRALLLGASHPEPYWRLSLHFLTQWEGQCAHASLAMILNALSVPAPHSEIYNQSYWDMDNINASDCTRRVPLRYHSIVELAAVAACAGPKTTVVQGNLSTAAEFRDTLKAAFSSPIPTIVAVNFARKTFDQLPDDGHHSPVGAFDEATDRVLIMDVARYNYPPFWVNLETLFEAMGNVPVPARFLKYSTPRGWWTAAYAASAADKTDNLMI